MEYPNTYFTRRFRVALLLVFVSIFLIATPVILLYTIGYRYDFINRLLQKTGGLSIDIEPKEAVATLDGQALKPGMPIRLKNIKPGKHALGLSAPNYFSWKKEIEIENNRTVYIKDFKLIKKAEPEFLTPGKISSISSSPLGDYLIYSKGIDGNYQVYLFDIQNQRTTLLSTLNGGSVPVVSWATKNNWAAVTQAFGNTGGDIILIDAAKPGVQRNLSYQRDGKMIQKLVWGATSAPELFYGSPAGVFVYLPEIDQTRLVSAETGFDWYLDNGKLWRIIYSTSTKKIVLEEDVLGFKKERVIYSGEDYKKDWRLVEVSNGVALIQAEQDSALIVDREQKFEIPAEHHVLSKYNNWWLLFSESELWSFQQGEDPFLLNRSGDRLKNVIPLDSKNTLALVWPDKITVLFPYYFVQHELARLQLSAIAAASERRLLFFGGKINDNEGLWKIEY